MNDIHLPITIDDIDIPNGRREVNVACVKRLADSIDKVGLRHPITVRERGDRYILVAGRHRIEAYKKLGREHIPSTIVKMTNDDARLWEIAENLHRSELTKLERDDNIAEWIKITERVQSRQVVANESRREDGRGHRPEGGIAAAARELGVHEKEAERAVKVASLSKDAKEAARESGLDNNRSALLEAARETEPARQVEKILNYKPKPTPLAAEPLNDFETTEKQVAALMAAWNRAGPEAREQFLERVDKPLVDKRWASQ